MSNEAQNERIRTALAQLDHDNDDHWTEDGLPRLAVVQKLASDGNFKRADMATAQPGFVRFVRKNTKASTDTLSTNAAAAESDPPEMTADGLGAEGTGLDKARDAEDEYVTEEEAREILSANVYAAEEALRAAQQDVRDSQERVTRAMAAVEKAKKDHARKFPPLTAAENIRQFIQSENQKRAAAVGAGHVYSQVDLAMSRGNSRGWRRPVRFQDAQQTRAVR